MAEYPYEARARIEKAQAIADCIILGLTDEGRRDPMVVELVRGADIHLRDRIAALADQNPPSEATWDLVVLRVERGLAAIRRESVSGGGEPW